MVVGLLLRGTAPLRSYAPATRCPVLTPDIFVPGESATRKVDRGPVAEQAAEAAEFRCGISLRSCHGMPGTDLLYAATRRFWGSKAELRRFKVGCYRSLCCVRFGPRMWHYALAMRCPVLSEAMLLPGWRYHRDPRLGPLRCGGQQVRACGAGFDPRP
eukprot:1718172-Rhodomonas_salina.1